MDGAVDSEQSADGPVTTLTTADAGPRQRHRADEQPTVEDRDHGEPSRPAAVRGGHESVQYGSDIRLGSHVGPYGRGASIGRYVVLEELGKGGMGAVYAAYDPELDRRVAVKLLGTRISTNGRKRFEREARALARLSHPNVVQVYDAGAHEGQVFAAMELVEGQTLKDWCKSEPTPSWRQVLRCYLDAARGLAAAHEKGLIHRDVRPANLLIGEDGRVRVADFGLAMAFQYGAPGDDSKDNPTPDDGQQSLDSAPAVSLSLSSSSSVPSSGSSHLEVRLEERFTQTGTLVGTLPFMAPEQHLGTNVGPAADQYSLCVSLYQGLYGQLPFPIPKRKQNAIHWLAKKQLAEFVAPADTEVPAWLHGVLCRGMSPEPESRYPSVQALIAALEDDPTQRRRARVRMAAFASICAIAVAALSVLGWIQLGNDRSAVCRGLDRELAELWNDEVKGEIRTAFASSGLPYAADTAARVLGRLDGYARSWHSMRTETCEATRVDQKQPENVMYLRLACLDRRRDQLLALAQLLATRADRDVVNRAVSATQGLLPIEYCGDIEALEAAVPPAEDPRVRARVHALQPRVDRLAVLYDAGKYREGVQRGQDLLIEMADLDYAPIRAQTVFALASMKQAVGDYDGAEAMFRDAIQMAARARDDVLAAKAWAELVWQIAWLQDRAQEGMVLVEVLNSSAQRADDDLARAMSLNSVAFVLLKLAKHRESRATFEDSLAIREKVTGPDHPLVAMSLNNLGLVHSRMGEYQAALDYYRRSLAITEKAVGPDHPGVATRLNNIGLTLTRMGEYEQARAIHQRALAIREKALDPGHPYLVLSNHSLANVFLYMGDYEQARATYQRAMAMNEEKSLSARPYSMFVRNGLGRTLVRTNDLDAAEPLIRGALLAFEKAYGPDHPRYARPLLALGELFLARQKADESVAVLQRALALDNQIYRAEIQLTLARALWAVGSERPRAVVLATEARDYYRRSGNQPMLQKAARWLAQHELTR